MRRKVSFRPWLCLILLLFAAPLHAEWEQDGNGICITSASQQYQRIVTDGENGAIVAFIAQESGGYCLYVQRLDAYGNPLWDSNGLKLRPSSNLNYPPIAMIPDGAGGAIVAWHDYLPTEGIYAQRIDGNGNLLWNPAGVAICTASGYQENSQLAADGAGGAYVVWQDMRGGSYYDIYAQRAQCERHRALGRRRRKRVHRDERSGDSADYRGPVRRVCRLEGLSRRQL